MQPFSFFFLLFAVGRGGGGGGGGGGISGRVRALNLTVLLGSGRVGSDDLGYGPGSGFSFEPVQSSNTVSRVTNVPSVIALIDSDNCSELNHLSDKPMTCAVSDSE